MIDTIRAILATFAVFFRSRLDISLEVLALRQQVAALKRKHHRPALNRLDRMFWIMLLNVWPRWSDVLAIVKPATVITWHRAGSDYIRNRSTAKAHEHPGTLAKRNFRNVGLEVAADRCWTASSR